MLKELSTQLLEIKAQQKKTILKDIAKVVNMGEIERQFKELKEYSKDL